MWREKYNAIRGYGWERMDKKIRMTKHLQGEIPKEYVPLGLLATHQLSTTAKIIWIVLYQDAPMAPERLFSPIRLSKRTGLTQKVIQHSLERIQASRWGAIIRDPNDWCEQTWNEMPKVYMPERLVTNRMIHLEARVLFGILQGTPGFRHNKGCFTYAGLGNLMRHEPEVVATYIRQLKSAGWLELTRPIYGRKIYFTIRDPTYTAHQHILRRVQRRVRRAPLRNALLMQEYLSLIVDSDGTEVDHAPESSVDSNTDANMCRETEEVDEVEASGAAFDAKQDSHQKLIR